MMKVVSEDAVRRGLAKIDEAAGLAWLQTHPDYCSSPLLSEPWVLDIGDSTDQAAIWAPGRHGGLQPAQAWAFRRTATTRHMMANLRLVLGVDVQPGDEHGRQSPARPAYGRCCIGSGAIERPALLRGDVARGVEPAMSRAEQDGLRYLFRLRMTANVKRALTKMMAERDWTNAGHGWQGKETTLRLVGWSRQRRVVLLRRKLDRPLLLVDRVEPGAWEYAALVTLAGQRDPSRWASCIAIEAIARTRSTN